MKKFIGIMVIFSLTFLFSSSLYAQNSMAEDGKSMLNLSDEGLAILAEQFEVDFANANKQKSRLIEERLEGSKTNNVIGDLELSDDFSRLRMTTFADTKTFSGEGRVGTQVGITVFHLNQQAEVQINQQKSVVIGMSRLFNESIDLANIGSNYILIVSENPDKSELKYGIYNIVRLEEEKKVELENVKIDFFNNAVESGNTSFFEQLNQMR